MCRTGTQEAVDRAAVRFARAGAQHMVLQASRRIGREPGADASDRRAVLADPVLRQPQVSGGAGRQSQAHWAADARDGHRGNLPQKAHDLARRGAQDLPVFTAECGEVARPDQVWASDITYVPLRHGFLYLVAVMDWYSRYVLSWRLSNTLTGGFCLEALDEALSRGRPEIFNSDQGSQFTAAAFTSRLESLGVAISMDGRGRAIDNVFIERLWRSVKYEEVYLRDYTDGWHAEASLAAYFRLYDEERIHQSLGYRTPGDVYRNRSSSGGSPPDEKRIEIARKKMIAG
jgi:transposase InsO family protein